MPENYSFEEAKELLDCSRASIGADNWQEIMKYAIQLFIEQTALKYKTIDLEHVVETPDRFVKALTEYVSGCSEDPRRHLIKQFSNGKYDQMIFGREIKLVSLCAHHLAPIFGKVEFAYIPDKYIVGLSKIPKFIRDIARRPQVQENISEEIVDIFQEVVQPKGCGVFVRAYHGCMAFRGAQEPMGYTQTNALRGSFKDSNTTRSEFISAIDHSRPVFP